MAILLLASPLPAAPFADALRAAAPDVPVWTSLDEAPPEAVELLIAWRLDAGVLPRLPKLRALCSLAAGVDKLVGVPDLPPGLAWGRAAVQELWPGADAPAVLARVLPPVVQVLRGFERDGFAPLQAGFARRDVLTGRAVTTTLPALPQGVADGVDANGTLWLRTADGQRHAVASGDVSLRPAAAPPPPYAG